MRPGDVARGRSGAGGAGLWAVRVGVGVDTAREVIVAVDVLVLAVVGAGDVDFVRAISMAGTGFSIVVVGGGGAGFCCCCGPFTGDQGLGSAMFCSMRSGEGIALYGCGRGDGEPV